ncbi:MAG: DEAD/DEAH box helicase family protein [Rivularia sp. (in: cyanobacteria)]
MPQIKIIRAALREIQKLPYSAGEKVYEILRSLSLGEITDTKSLQGYDKLLRTRQGHCRVIWFKEDTENIVVIKAGLRGSVYDGEFERRNSENPQLIAELLNPQQIELYEHPAYQWDRALNLDWYKFIFSSYHYSPVRTNYQKELLDKLFQPFSTYRYGADSQDLSNKACIIQSAPGTGKTVCATLLACEIHRQQEWNIVLIVPDALKKDIAKYSEIQQALIKDNFWLVNFQEWLYKINLQFENCLASPEEELTALQQAANRTHLSFSNSEEISYRDVLLYQSFVLDEDNRNEDRNAIYQVNKKRIKNLEKIQHQRWLNELKGKKSRIDAVRELKNNIPLLPFDNPYTLVIVDEAQDFMLCELQALIATCKEWNRQSNLTHLWLLGDLNQRIQPTDFNWGKLHLRETISLKRNYRNSRYILEFANQFRHLAQEINSELNAQHLPAAANPEDAFEVGEKVRVLKCDSTDDALIFLQQFARQDVSVENKRYLLHYLANTVKVISNNNLDIYDDNLVILNAEDAKGREFEACVACGLFTGSGKPSLEEAFQWYTLLTRARSRLLIVVTPEELNRLNLSQRDYFENCLSIDSQSAIGWITELASDVDISKISDVKQRLLKRCETGHLYWDTYLALQLAGIEGSELYQWEKDAISRLKKHSNDYLKSELNHIQNISLRCLLWRAMDFSWQAVLEATNLEEIDFNEYERLLYSIAKDLELKGLIYEAARVKALKREDNHHDTFPFWQEINQNSNSSQSLVKLLCEAFASRIDNIL